MQFNFVSDFIIPARPLQTQSILRWLISQDKLDTHFRKRNKSISYFLTFTEVNRFLQHFVISIELTAILYQVLMIYALNIKSSLPA